MYRFIKFIGILIVLGIVSFLICDEKGVKINTDNGYIVFQQEKTFIPIYKADSKLVHFYSGFEDIDILSFGTKRTYSNDTRYIHFYRGFRDNVLLRKSAGIKTGIPALLSSTTVENNDIEYVVPTHDNPSSTHLVKTNNDTLSDMLIRNQHPTRAVESYKVSQHKSTLSSATEINDVISEYTEYIENDFSGNKINQNSGTIVTGVDITEYAEYANNDFPGSGEFQKSGLNETLSGNVDNIQPEILTGNVVNSDIEFTGNVQTDLYIETGLNLSGENYLNAEKTTNTVSVKPYKVSHSVAVLNYGIEIPTPTKSVDKYEITANDLNLGYGVEKEIITVSVIPFVDSHHYIQLKKGISIKPIINTEIQDIDNKENGNQISSSELEQLLIDDEIDVDSLESENDEVLQKIFAKNHDSEIMNLIVENYLNEYQFVKAKKFIENLPESSYSDLDPLLNLRVIFNSFSLTSQSIATTLTELVNSYQNQISSDDINRYLGVIALMQKDYDKFFEISNNFQSEKYKNFTAKIQSLQEQTSKEMGIPDYYLDTLVALELFNQGLFQPSKVIAISSLSQDSNYILPYQLLGYANFLTNSWDTAIEYFKKLIDLDSNNAEKYRFLMGVAYYRGEKYEQSVVMLSMINEGKLRLDAERYLIRNYIILDQKNKLISSRGKLLGYDNLTASDFYTYFNEAFYRPYAEGLEFTLYAYDAGLGDKMIKVCQITLPEEERVVCGYGSLGKEIALGNFEGLEQSLLSLVGKYPQSYLYHALGEYYIKNGDIETAKSYLLKAVSLTQTKGEKSQIKKLLQDVMN